MFIDNEYVQAGFTAGQMMLPAASNPLLHDGQPRELWKLGHALALTMANGTELDAETLTRVPADPETQGRAAFLRNIRHEDNPYGFGDPHGSPEEVATNEAHAGWDKGWRLEADTNSRMFDPARRTLPLYDIDGTVRQIDIEPEPAKPTGGNTNYYLANVLHPKRGGPTYMAECEDITHALKMTPEEFCEFKAIWRTAAARLGNVKPGHKAVYDAEKRVHYANLSLTHERRSAMAMDIDTIAPI